MKIVSIMEDPRGRARQLCSRLRGRQDAAKCLEKFEEAIG